jgi:protein TonB
MHAMTKALLIIMMTHHATASFSQTQIKNNIKIDENAIFAKAEIEPKFPGGDEAWRKYLLKNVNTGIPSKKGAPAGVYFVIVRFIVSKDGQVLNINPLTKVGYAMEEEAVRIIKNGPNWIPALQNGKKVNAFTKQSLTFVISK